MKEQLTHSVTLRLTVLLWLKSLLRTTTKLKNTLAGVEKPDAYTDYLMAVLGARTNNLSMLTSSLKSAVAKRFFIS